MFPAVEGTKCCEVVAKTSASASILVTLVETVYTMYTNLCSNKLICIHQYLRLNMESKIARKYITKYRQKWMFDKVKYRRAGP